MEEEKNKSLSFLEKMKQTAKEQKNYGGKTIEKGAKMNTVACPNCGAGRTKNDGLTKCAYCGYEFIAIELSNGLNIKKDDNSK